MKPRPLLAAALEAADRGWLPDSLVRFGIRRLCSEKLRQLGGESPGARRATESFIDGMRRGPIAPVPEKANEQHYELPPEFFRLVLGPRLKYSSCLWPPGVETLERAEEAALAETCARAGIEDGMEILELGCGWGSLLLWMAERYPRARVTGVSNSAPQGRFIEALAAERGLTNVRAVTADMNAFSTDARFDRVVSIEMFEHMRNYEALLRRIAGWLRADGKLFVHIFCHQRHAYPFEAEGSGNWMGKHFFTGGIMPSEEILGEFPDDLAVVKRWRWDGTHYARSAEAWLDNIDRREGAIRSILAEHYGPAEASRWFHRWRIFFMACAELFGYGGGGEWFVSHALLEPVPRGACPVSSDPARAQRTAP